MHKGVMLLTKASDKEEANSNVREFLEDYGNGNVWDWYVVGGRWSGTLNEKANEFNKLAEAHFKKAYPENDHPFLTTDMIKEQADVLDKIWREELGQTTANPYSRSSYEENGDVDDIVPLSECLNVINEWKKDTTQVANEYWEKMLAAKSEKSGHDMSAYYAKRYAEAVYDEFCFDSNVYDIDNQTNNPEDAIKEAGEYFVVMIDMHN